MHATAADNIRRYRSNIQKCTDIVSICQDATNYAIPDEQAIFYFYHPFVEPVMKQVLTNIEQSLSKHPRDVYLIYYNPKARHIIDDHSAFRSIGNTSVYCIYRSCVNTAKNADRLYGAIGK